MGIIIRRAGERGRTRLPWLDGRHTFSFGEYHDPHFMGFGALRVINDDRVAPAGGFSPHPHRDMEIVTIVLQGALAHKDSLGHGSVIRPGDVQRMSAGRGIVHSEFNASETEPVHLLQIWIHPRERRLEPGYEQKALGPMPPGVRVLVTPDGHDGSLSMQAEARILGALAGVDAPARVAITPGRIAWVHVVEGAGELIAAGERVALGEADGAGVRGATELELVGAPSVSAIIFEVVER
ncbi:MAG: pirin family protein [Phycisphaerales bacterium]|nr:pirin family protein [Phycisphaerales bacterium]